MTTTTEITLTCGGWCSGRNEVTMIGSKGYVYCTPCGAQRRQSGWENVRQMRRWEIDTLKAGGVLSSYAPGPKPTALAPKA